MSQDKLRQEAERWLAQAEDDLAAARVLRQAGHHALAAFHGQQAGEKALKGLWRRLDLDPWGHSAVRLLGELPPGRTNLDVEALLPLAAALDKLYIPTRYPDALPGITPSEAFTEEEATRAIEQAGRLMEAVRAVL